jgi:uncharacterized protein (DUF2126 family)
MKKILTFISIFLSLNGFTQVSSNIEKPELYVEPLSVQSLKDVWVDDAYENRRVGLTMIVSGLAVVGLGIYEGPEAWKRPTSSGWVYKPFISQSTRPFMMATGVALTGTGIGIILYNK